MQELRVAIFTGNYNYIRDGAALTLNRLVKYLEEQNIPVLVFAPEVDEPAFKHNGTMVGTPSIPMLVPGRDEYRIAYRFPKSAQKRLEEFAPTIVHVATPDGLGTGALKWANKNNISAVTSYHTHFLSYASYYRLLQGPVTLFTKLFMKWFYKRFIHTYVPSQSMIDELNEFGLEGEKRIWARGINLDLFNPSKRDMDWRRSVGFSDDDIVVTFVSRLVWEKELNTYIESVKRIQKKNKNIRALIVGDGPAQKEVEEKLPQAHFTGFVTGEELARAYASSDVFMFPSHTETFGNVTLEAMASGLPCLVADAIGSKSLVDDGKNGKWAEKKSVKDFTKKLEWMVQDENRLKEMGIKSREMALEYDWDKINAGLVDNYKEAIQHSKA
jgi:glycosyltransferase involved in cell wall biosynthesis